MQCDGYEQDDKVLVIVVVFRTTKVDSHGILRFTTRMVKTEGDGRIVRSIVWKRRLDCPSLLVSALVPVRSLVHHKCIPFVFLQQQHIQS